MEQDKFSIPPLDKQELNKKLGDVIYPNEYENDVGWRYGAPRWAVEDLVKAWKAFDWNKSSEEMSRWNHYKSNVDGTGIHYVHETSAKDNAVPIILIHGWPSTFYEFHKVIEPLRDGNNSKQAFHVVVPSLPGFGFSDCPKKPGCSVSQIAELFHHLMQKLGYDKYIVHGTDWGSSIGKAMALNYPNHCLGYHTNMPIIAPPVPNLHNLLTSPIQVILFLMALIFGTQAVYKAQDVRLFRSFANADKDDRAGYRAIQSTRPYTLAYGLSDSPVGLLGWILEPYHAWTSHTPEKLNTNSLPETISVDEFLTQISIYWITNTMSSSTRIYYEFKEEMKKSSRVVLEGIKVPYGVSAFPNELTKFPREWFPINNNLIQYKDHPHGGHFPALEVPELLLDDLQTFGKKVVKK
ncbi:alpha/beta-hydrolase [Backusella circina FSU 941]|nr:alpha/beta-hydrolase [Backusella circina FSU 941]